MTDHDSGPKKKSQRWNFATLWASKWLVTWKWLTFADSPWSQIPLLVYFGIRLRTTDISGTWSRKTSTMSHKLSSSQTLKKTKSGHRMAQAPSNLHNLSTETCQKSSKAFDSWYGSFCLKHLETGMNQSMIRGIFNVEISETSNNLRSIPQCPCHKWTIPPTPKTSPNLKPYIYYHLLY